MLVVLLGIASGFYGALFGVGGGTIIVPGLIWLGQRPRVAAATSLAAIGITSAAGAAFYAWRGEVRPLDALLLGVPASAGVLFGVAFQQRLHSRALTGLFALLLAGVGMKLVVG
jgi:uncharacterized membrane protein YfcA